ncbi:hypothetical protein ACNOYE_12870 [Nannocystaceae bacterium ST9]
MKTKQTQSKPVVVGASDHGGWAILVTAASDGTFLDRRRVELVDEGLPTMPHHHEGQKLPIEQAVALVERVRGSADRNAKARLAALAAELDVEIAGIALRECPPLPETLAERITNYRAMCVADWVMYRQSLAKAASERGWFVHWYDAKRVSTEAASALERETLAGLLAEVKARVGSPWQKDHAIAMAAAIAAANASAES